VYSRFRLNWANFLVHFSFSTVCASFYAVVAEYNLRIKFLQGAAFGIVVWVVSHLLIMPILRLTAATLRLPFEENLSECFGHAVWMWSIEMVRRDLRSRITQVLPLDMVDNSTSLCWLLGPFVLEKRHTIRKQTRRSEDKLAFSVYLSRWASWRSSDARRFRSSIYAFF
jgi:hypothetical protein